MAGDGGGRHRSVAQSGSATGGGSAPDPSRNVLDLVDAAVLRLDDLREMESRYTSRIADLRAEYDEKLRRAETARIDAIRAVDVGAVNRAAEVSAQQAQTLAAQVATSAETLRTQVAAAAAASNTEMANRLDPIQKAIDDLRKAQYEAAGGRSRGGETRLNLGAIISGISLLIVLVVAIFTLTR